MQMTTCRGAAGARAGQGRAKPPAARGAACGAPGALRGPTRLQGTRGVAGAQAALPTPRLPGPRAQVSPRGGSFCKVPAFGFRRKGEAE